MRQWDSWARYLRSGGGGSWPRDAFESLLDYFDELLEEKDVSLERGIFPGSCPKKKLFGAESAKKKE